MKKFILLALLPVSVCAEDFYVQDELADMVEDVVRATKFEINIPDMATKYIRINQIDGLDVCKPEAKQKVKKLQTAFNEHPNIYHTKSIHGAYYRNADGKLAYTPFEQTRDKSSNNKCEYITVSVR